MHRAFVIGAMVGVVLWAGPASGGVWFDIGSSDTTYVHANGEATSWERYPPQPFGPFPPGTLVYEDISIVPCGELVPAAPTCSPSILIRGFRVFFSDAGCGCGGFLVKPTTLRLRYDAAVVAAAGRTESALRLIFTDEITWTWTLVNGAVVDTAGDFISVSWDRNILGTRQYAIVTHDITPTNQTTWGRLKAIYR